MSFFCEYEGLKILRQWIKFCLEEDSVALLRLIISLCKKVPFNISYISKSEIGKVIKKALKHESKVNDIHVLKTEINEIMEIWRGKMSLVSNKSEVKDENLKIISDSLLPSLVKEIDDRLLDTRGPCPIPLKDETDTSKNDSDKIISSSTTKTEAIDEIPPKKRKLPDDKINQKKTQGNSIITQEKPKPNFPETKSLLDININYDNVPDIVPFKIASAKPKIRKFSELNVKIDTIPVVLYDPPPKNTKPGPGGLKKSNRSGLEVQFKEKLCEIYDFEVDKIGTKDLSAYKNSKEMAKRENMIKKERIESSRKEMENYKIPWKM